ncbi:hypothetical protein EVAR_12903_1 [Eumeta japonica]|uniref:Uncharacterized protein n=1 Tax=Eumeta variegata TaxID=151549 RepID=A0A4C1TVQ4_EUMVA|nr:hypothetical protein EVAR_12903_1 [Eumeta japonica]
MNLKCGFEASADPALSPPTWRGPPLPVIKLARQMGPYRSSTHGTLKIIDSKRSPKIRASADAVRGAAPADREMSRTSASSVR